MLNYAKLHIVALVVATLSISAGAQGHLDGEVEAVTSDGRVVVLRGDHTWDFVEVEPGNPETSAVLTVTEVKEMQDACGLQLRLQNNLGFKIRSLVPRFSVYNDKNVVFDHRSQSFTSIKPGRDQYKRIQFNGIGCHEIVWIRVHDAQHCTMGDHLDMFNAEEGQCLSYIYVEPSKLINISKEPNL
ncbi:MAG: DUF3157 family protein [Gammaproteobacteria bacterium]|jgi:uncharacterized protein YcsI (UPF0317 family)|nr:DUF3157 family protein [Gammaproteobacteria bacterium]